MASSQIHSQALSLKVEQLFTAIWQSSTDGIRLVDEEGRIVKVNRAYSTLVHKPEAELIGIPFYEVYAAETHAEMRREMLRNYASRSAPDIVEQEYTMWDGSKLWLELSNSIVEFDNGVFLVLSIVRDRTEHKRKDKALEAAEEHFRMLYENAPLSYQSLDYEGRLLDVNPPWLKTFGYARNEVIGKKFTDFMTPDSAKLMVEVFLRLVNDGEVHNVEFEMIRHDKSHCFVNYEGKLATELSGKFKQTHCILTDITERKRTQEELQKLYIETRKYAHLKEELLNEVNHRVKNNLMTILGLILAEKRRLRSPHPSSPETTWNEFEARIHGLLKVHQMLSDSQWAPLNLGDLTQRILLGVVSIYESVITAEIRVEPSDIVVSPRQANNLALVLNELTTNSLKHGLAVAPSPEIHVSFWTENNNICIEFRDNGKGYPADVLSNKVENVGLHLVRQLIQETLRGKVKLLNKRGAVTLMTIKPEEISRT